MLLCNTLLQGVNLLVLGMWPVLFRVLRTYSPYITLPFAAIVGLIGYNLESRFSDKYTPFNGKFFFYISINVIFNS